MIKTIHLYSFITCGAFIQGMAMALFLFPHSIPSGGAAGIAVLINYWFHVPLSIALWLVNFSLIVAAIFWLGNSSAIGTMYAITITSFSVHIFSMDIFIHYSNVWIDLILGAITLGIGVGILLRNDVSNGGMGVLALIIAKYRRTAPGKPLLFLNGSIFIITASIINWHIVIQAIICQTIAARLIDYIYNVHLPTVNIPAISWRRK